MAPSFKIQHYIFRHVYKVWYIIWYIQFHQFQFWGSVTWLGCWGGVSGNPWSGFVAGVAGMGCGCGLAGLGISWIQRYSLLSDTGSLSHMGSSSFAIGRSSSSSLESVANTSGSVSSKASCWNGGPLGCFRVKGCGLVSWVEGGLC